MEESTFNSEESANDAILRALKSRGIANVLIAGKTGAGRAQRRPGQLTAANLGRRAHDSHAWVGQAGRNNDGGHSRRPKNAFAAAQCIVLGQKVNRAHKAVAAAAAAAGGVAAAPIPSSDALAIVPIQIMMLADISACFGLEITTVFIATLVSGTITSAAGTIAGRSAVGALLKFIPGFGSLAGGLISASVATSLTVAFGEAYVATLQTLLKDDPEKHLSGMEVAEAFKKKMGG